MYDRILVPTDGGEQAQAAARHAVELAETHGATVFAVYVVDTETSWLTVSKTEVRDTLREVGEDTGSQALEAVESLAREAGVALHTELREGAPDAQILASVEDNDIDLVVLGTHGRDGVRRRLVGSVAERIVRDAPVPVLTIEAETDERE